MSKIDCKHVVQVSGEAPPGYDSQAKGGIEVDIRIVNGLLRTVKMCLDQFPDMYMSVGHPVVAWRSRICAC